MIGVFVGFLIIYAKLSDILGCKVMLLLAITLFTIFSIACGLSNSMLLLYVMLPALSPSSQDCF
jgi:MFS family permease